MLEAEMLTTGERNGGRRYMGLLFVVSEWVCAGKFTVSEWAQVEQLMHCSERAPPSDHVLTAG
jgi:hypothetical protein